MRIALVHMRHAQAGGTERYLNHLARHLAQRGDEVTIVCRSRETTPHPSVRFELLRPLALGAAWRMSSFAKSVEEHVRGAGYDLVYGLGKGWAQDVVRLGGGLHATYLELAHESTRAGWKRFLPGSEKKHKLALAAEARALTAPELVRIVVNARMVQRDAMARYDLPEERFRLVYNGVDLERFHPRRRAQEGAALRREFGIDAQAPVVLFLGSGYGRKGLDRVLEAFGELRRGRADARLVVVGYDSQQASFEKLAAKLGLQACVHFLGGRRDAEVCFSASDLYILPTRYDPFANTTLEALATGLPVITTRGNGAHELIEERVQGSVLENPEDEQGMALAMAWWLDPANLERGRLAARALAEQHSAESKMQQSAAILDEALAEKRSR
ncbi:MAG: glycosyltransferase family 4 protein [Planctomycetes bacterium]|nr:glycosyltransferase family 4 protein [Planctomycetota bacterium]